MTSASELFHNRRPRLGRNNHAFDLGFDSSPERFVHYSFSRRHHSHSNHRRDLNGCDPFRRSQHLRRACNRLPYSERESVRLSEGTSHSGSSNSTNPETLLNLARLTGNDRLPGTVLLARERLLQRLSDASLSDNRQRRLSSDVYVHRNRTMISNSLRAIDAEDLETEISAGLSTGSTFLEEVASQVEHLRLQWLQQSKKKPPGLTQDALNCLRLEVFNSTEKSVEMESSSALQDCGICLESFTDGDKLICLPCEHRFHSACLDPWVRTCGNCPYCRRDIGITSHRSQAIIKRT